VLVTAPDDVGLDSSGEAERLTLRHPFRWSRAGLYYFSRRYACWTVTLTRGELAALQQGREILIAVGTEYLLLVRKTLDSSTADPESPNHQRAGTDDHV
jgi:hypothetical protein